MFKKLTLLGLTLALTLSMALPVAVQAEETGFFPDDFQTTVETGALLDTDAGLLGIIAGLVNVFMGLLGMLAVVLMLYGGFIWMTAQGDPEKVQKAQNIIKTAVVGIIVIFAAWALATFAIDYIASTAVSGGTVTG